METSVPPGLDQPVSQGDEQFCCCAAEAASILTALPCFDEAEVSHDKALMHIRPAHDLTETPCPVLS